MRILFDAWAGLDNTGRIVLVVCAAGLLALALWLGVDLRWLPALLGAS